MLKIAILAVAGIAIVAFIAVFNLKSPASGEPRLEKTAAPPSQTTAAGGGQAVSIPLASLEPGKAKFFEHKTADGITVRYFVVKGTDGVARAAFDACDACWPEGKGYKQDGGEMVCGNCQMRFPVDRINEVKGGCNPSPLNRSAQGDQLVIRVSDIEAGKNYFNLKK
ncbi:DUF2318 domain-containing protein [bacterium]|nr:MAG: DUF2318 domain-containing protein [bacterium]